MAHITHCQSTTHRNFFKPLFDALNAAKHRRRCPELNDALWLEAGVRRCLELVQSGRDFLQQLADEHDAHINNSTFFESLKSERRLRLLDEILAQVRARMSREMPDPFAAFPCLKDFDLYAGDGHFISAACHDKAVPRSRPASAKPGDTTRHKSTKYATGHLYALDQRSYAMIHLTVADQIERKKEHEMRALKRQTIETLRQGAAKGRKPLYVWDRAGIDFRQWYQWKHQYGIYFLSREKDNMNLEVIGCLEIDRSQVINRGVLADEFVATSQGVSVRRVIYQDPATGVTYSFLTNLPESVPPGVVALLYKMRWDVEKVFDEFKNKLAETKSWASSPTAKTIQARLLCLTRNLMTLMEEDIYKTSAVCNEAEFKRRDKRAKDRARHQPADRESAAPEPNNPERTRTSPERTSPEPVSPEPANPEPANPDSSSPLEIAVLNAFNRLTQRTVKFIRWLRNHLDLPRSWEAALARLAHVYSRM